MVRDTNAVHRLARVVTRVGPLGDAPERLAGVDAMVARRRRSARRDRLSQKEGAGTGKCCKSGDEAACGR